MARIMKWDGFNLLAPQNMTKNLVGYGDLKPTDVRGNMLLKDNSAGVPNRFFASVTNQQEAARVLWGDLNTRGTGSQTSTGAFQIRFWYYASSGFKTIPSGLHYSWARSYNTAGEWIHCLNYRGRDLVMRTGDQYGNKEIVVWKNALSDTGWANKWHRIELSCNNTIQGSAVKIDSRSWVTSYWSKTNNPILASFSLGASESSSPSNVAFRNLEIIDNHNSANFTYDWVPPVAPKITLPATVSATATGSDVAVIQPTSATVGEAPITSAKWWEVLQPEDSPWASKNLVKTELTANLQDPANFSLERGPYLEAGSEKYELVVEDENNFKVSRTTTVQIGAGFNTGPEYDVVDKEILVGSGTTVNLVTTSAGNNGATYPENMLQLELHTGVQAPTSPYGPVFGSAYTYDPLESNPANIGRTITYTRTGTASWNVLTINFDPFTVPGFYEFYVSLRNSNGEESTRIFSVTVEAADAVVFTAINPAPMNEYNEVPTYLVGETVTVQTDVTSGNAGNLVLAGYEVVGATISNETLANTGTESDGAATIMADMTITDDTVEFNTLSFSVRDSLGNTSNQEPVYFGKEAPVAPTIDLTDDFLVNAEITPSFTIQAFVTNGTFEIDPETYQWQVLVAPTGYDGLLTFDTYALTFANYDTQGNYTFEYKIDDVEGNTYYAQCHVFISMGATPDSQKPRDILDWMSNTQLEHEATKALSGITANGSNKQDIEWYLRQLLPLQIPNIATMSFVQIQREYYKALINGNVYRDNGIYGTIDGGTPDDIIVEDEETTVPPDDSDNDSDNPDSPPIVPDPVDPPVDPPTPAEITYDHVVTLQHNPRRVIQSFAWDQPRDVWFGAQVNPDSVHDTLIYKFDSTGSFLGTMNMINAGHGSSIAHQRVGTSDYIWTSHAAYGIDENRSIVRGKYTNGGSITFNSPDMQKTPNFYNYYSPVNIYNNYITIATRVNGVDTFRQYMLDDYLAGNNDPIRVRSVKLSTSMGAYQGHTADEKYIYVARGGSSYDTAKPETLWDKPHVRVYRWSDGKTWIINTTAVGMDVASGRSESEGIQRYDVGSDKNIYIGKATGKTGARVHKVYKFTRAEMENWINNG